MIIFLRWQDLLLSIICLVRSFKYFNFQILQNIFQILKYLCIYFLAYVSNCTANGWPSFRTLKGDHKEVDVTIITDDSCHEAFGYAATAQNDKFCTIKENDKNCPVSTKYLTKISF